MGVSHQQHPQLQPPAADSVYLGVGGVWAMTLAPEKVVELSALSLFSLPFFISFSFAGKLLKPFSFFKIPFPRSLIDY